MSEIAAKTEIEAPVERVFAVVTDPDRLGEWLTVHDDVDEAPPQPLREGAEFEQRVAVKGARIPIVWTATTVEPPTRVVLEGEGPAGARAQACVSLRAIGETRTYLEYSCSYEPPGGVIGKVANRLAGEQAATGEAMESFDRLRRLLD